MSWRPTPSAPEEWQRDHDWRWWPATTSCRRSPPRRSPGRPGSSSAAAARARPAPAPNGCAPRRSAICAPGRRRAAPHRAHRPHHRPGAQRHGRRRLRPACRARAARAPALRGLAQRDRLAQRRHRPDVRRRRSRQPARARSSTPPGATSSPSGAGPTTPGTCCSSACASALSRRPSSPPRRAPSARPEEAHRRSGHRDEPLAHADNATNLAPGFVRRDHARATATPRSAARSSRARSSRSAPAATGTANGSTSASRRCRAGPGAHRRRRRSAGHLQRRLGRLRYRRRRPRRRRAAATCSPTAPSAAASRSCGRAPSSPPIATMPPTASSPRSTRAATSSSPSSARSTRTCRSAASTPRAASGCAPSPSRRSMPRAASPRRRVAELEGQMCAFGADGLANGKSPDRLDALVWAITELMLAPTRGSPTAISRPTRSLIRSKHRKCRDMSPVGRLLSPCDRALLVHAECYGWRQHQKSLLRAASISRGYSGGCRRGRRQHCPRGASSLASPPSGLMSCSS